MSAIQQAAANTVFRIANLFEQNCAIKHGLPKVGGPDRIDSVDPAPIAPLVPQPINITNNIPAAPAATDSPSPGAADAATVESRSLLRRAAPWLLGAAAIGGGAGTGYLLHGQSPAQPPSVVNQTEQQKDGSLLQYLQDRGQHLKEGTWPTKQ